MIAIPSLALAHFEDYVMGWSTATNPHSRSFAAGDGRLDLNDRHSGRTFPGQTHKHHYIGVENVHGDNDGTDAADGVSDQVVDVETRGEAAWEWRGATVFWGVNRKTPASYMQEIYSSDAGKTAALQDRPARSMIDFGWGSESMGFGVTFGTSSETVPTPETDDDPSETETQRNMALDVIAGWNLANGMEVAPFIGFSSFGYLSGDEQKKSGFHVGANVRDEVALPFFNHWVVGGSFIKGPKESNDAGDDAPNAFAADFKLFNYTDDSMAGGGDGIRYLLAIGTGFVSIDDGDSASKRATIIQLPTATAGAEYGVTDWLDISGSVSRAMNFYFQEDNNQSGTGGTVTTVGANAHWGHFALEAVLNNRLFEDGPNFVGGRNNGVSNVVAAVYTF
jgi:hypothetical protein